MDRTRHEDRARKMLQKISLRLEGWHEVSSSLMVSRVGSYIFDMEPAALEFSPARIVVEISVINGRKVIYVRSAVVLENKLDRSVDIRLEFSNAVKSAIVKQSIGVGQRYAVPVHCASSVLRLRPSAIGFAWSDGRLCWEQVRMLLLQLLFSSVAVFLLFLHSLSLKNSL